MSLRDWIAPIPAADERPLTSAVIDGAMKRLIERGSEPMHRCEFDGHVGAVGSYRCIYCGTKLF